MTTTTRPGVPMRRQRIIDQLQVTPGSPAGLDGRDTGWVGGDEFAQLSSDDLDQTAKDLLHQGIEELSDAQELLWATDRYAVLVVFQAMDAAGKDSTIKHVMSGVNPQGVDVMSFKQADGGGARPRRSCGGSGWRCRTEGGSGSSTARTTRRSSRCACTRSGSAPQCLPAGPVDESFWAGRYEDLNTFEHHLDRNGHEGHQVLPPRLEGGTEAAFHGSPRPPGQGVEVQRRRRRRARANGRATWRRSSQRSRRHRQRGRRGT